MSNTIADTFNWMTGVLGLAVVLSLAMPAIERPLLYLLVVGSTLAHWEYGSTVVSCTRIVLRSYTKLLGPPIWQKI